MLQRRTPQNMQPYYPLDNQAQELNPQLLEKYDKKLLQWLVNFHNVLNKDQLNLDDVGSLLDVLKHLTNENQDHYIHSLLYPENYYAKIPTAFPVPTSEVRQHLSTTIKTSNASTGPGGNFAFVYNPFFSADINNTASSTYYLNTDTTLTGTGSNDNFIPRQLGQGEIPINMYSTYRLVSCAITINYTGRMDIVSGVIGCGLGFNGVCPVGTVDLATAKSTNAALYGNFNLVDDSYFSQRTQSVNGLRMVYFPLDNTYCNFYNMNSALNGFYFIVYGQNLPIDSACIRVDVYLNFEYTVNPIYSSYVASSPGSCGDTLGALNSATSLFQKNPSFISQNTGEVPGKPSVSAGGFLHKLLGGTAKALEYGVNNISKVLPGIGVIKNMVGLGSGMYNTPQEDFKNTNN
jgi:hypothetical protein